MISEIIKKCKSFGWVLEPYANQILHRYNIKIPDYIFTNRLDEAKNFVKKTGFPVVCKVVSPKIIHKSDVGGVIVGINNITELENAFKKLINIDEAIGVIIEKMVNGIELIIGGKNDLQFGPVVILGMGGIGVEIYNDSVIRMAPLKKLDVEKMLKELKFYPILKGYRGKKGINLEKLIKTTVNFSKLIMELEPYYESVDLNPVICNENDCFVADARIILKNS